MVSSVSGYSAYARPDPSEMASKLFSKLDSSNKGYLEVSDLQAAMQKASGSSSSSTATSSSSSVSDEATQMFKALDSDGNGQVTESEFSSTLQKLAASMQDQAVRGQVHGHHGGGQGGPQGAGGMPPPPPKGDGDGDADDGFTKDQLTSQLQSASATSSSSGTSSTSSTSSADDARTQLISSIVSNFEKADTNKDGKVSGAEARAYADSSRSSSSSSSSSSSADSTAAGSTGSASVSQRQEAALMHRIMKLAHAYGTDNSTTATQAASSGLSAIA